MSNSSVYIVEDKNSDPATAATAAAAAVAVPATADSPTPGTGSFASQVSSGHSFRSDNAHSDDAAFLGNAVEKDQAYLNKEDNSEHENSSQDFSRTKGREKASVGPRKPTTCYKCCRWWLRCDTVHHPLPSSSSQHCDRCSWTCMQCGGGPLRFFVWPLLIPLLLRIFADETACPYTPACPAISGATNTTTFFNSTLRNNNMSTKTNSVDVQQCGEGGHSNTTTTCQIFQLADAFTEEWNGGEYFLWSDLLALGFNFNCK